MRLDLEINVARRPVQQQSSFVFDDVGVDSAAAIPIARGPKDRICGVACEVNTVFGPIRFYVLEDEDPSVLLRFLSDGAKARIEKVTLTEPC